MSKQRKTIDVLEMKNLANEILSVKNVKSEYSSYEYKLGVITMIETILHNTGNYRGFMFLDIEDMEFGTPGYVTRKYF